MQAQIRPNNIHHEITICEQRQQFIDHNGHCLVLGGAGSGKTTIALIKAESDIANSTILSFQKILFLSFARATISRVIEKSKAHLDINSQKHLEINTYHGYCWSLLQSHGYLIGLNRKIKLITPADAAAHLAEIRNENILDSEKKRLEKAEVYSLAFNEGIICFNIFAELTKKILNENSKLAEIICNRYPIIVLDEFQDTNSEEWELIKELGKYSRLISLADPDQRIYEFRGADPARIRQFIEAFSPRTFDFGQENNRSPGTDIAKYGNDILDGSNKIKKYANVLVKKWGFVYKSPTYVLKANVIQAIRRLNSYGKQWNIAILVPTKRLMLTVSDALNSNTNGLPVINHTVSIDPEGPTLAARVIAFLLEPVTDLNKGLSELVKLLSIFFRGKGGSNPAAMDLNQSKSLQSALVKALTKGVIPNNSVIKRSADILTLLAQSKFTGDPEKDWLFVRQLLRDSNCPRLSKIAQQASYIRLLGKGSQLRENLAETWRRNGSYLGAVIIVEFALVQEHFVAATKKERGVLLMNMHKAKGKEFDEVILFEDQYSGRFYSTNSNIDQARRNLRVSVTRARQLTTILTPAAEPCSLLF